MLVFVYGTLKKGYCNNDLMESVGAKFILKTVTKHKYYMVSTGVPFVIMDNRIRRPEILRYKGHITIEEYQVDKNKITEIDALEGHPNWYKREVIGDILGNKGWLYFNNSINIEDNIDSLVMPVKEIINF